MARPRRQIELGDFQTPDALARAVCLRLAQAFPPPTAVVEPTCGDGALLVASQASFPDAHLLGLEIDPRRAMTARARLPGARIVVGDAFDHDWEATVGGRGTLVLGNPPWVTNAALGALSGTNRPVRRNDGKLAGLDALTGASNFDVSEWLLRRLHMALPDDGRVAMLVKTSVARRLLCIPDLRPDGLWHIDAGRHFGAAVDACLFVFGRGAPRPCPIYDRLEADAPQAAWGLRGGRVVRDVVAYDTVRLKLPTLKWRSGVKHDCARVFELRDGKNGLGEVVEIEAEVRFPLAKATDLHRGRVPAREVLLPHRTLRDDPGRLEAEAPRAWAYLLRHGERLDARRSRIYRDRPRFSVFGVGDYSFAPWKVAVSGMHTPPRFRVVGPHRGRPVLFDDTCYFAPAAGEAEASMVVETLESPDARRLLESLIFPGSKRPVTKRVLDALVER